MGCNRISGNSVDIFICSRGEPKEQCSRAGCSAEAITSCQFALQGRKLGQRCDRPLCARCSQVVNSTIYCEPHAYLINNLETDDQ